MSFTSQIEQVIKEARYKAVQEYASKILDRLRGHLGSDDEAIEQILNQEATKFE